MFCVCLLYTSIRFDIFADIAKEVGAYLFVDMAHIAGLVAAGLHQSPVPYADVVTTTTHKTLRGPRGGMIMCKEEYAKAINKAIFPGTQGGPLMHIIAAKAVCFGEALKPEFKTYQEQVVKNAKALAEAMVEEGFNLVSGGTDNQDVYKRQQYRSATYHGTYCSVWLGKVSDQGSVCGTGKRIFEHLFECDDLSGQDSISGCKL